LDNGSESSLNLVNDIFMQGTYITRDDIYLWEERTVPWLIGFPWDSLKLEEQDTENYYLWYCQWALYGWSIWMAVE